MRGGRSRGGRFCILDFGFWIGKLPGAVCGSLLLVAMLELSAIAQSVANLPGTARIQSISGNGKVRIEGEAPPRKFFAGVRTPLNKGDLIFPEKGVRVTVLCPDGSRRPVRAGVPSGLGSICLVWRTHAARGTQDVRTTGGIDTSIPYLIAPRHSLLLSATPLLRWNPVVGVNQYTVEVRNQTNRIWKTQTANSQIPYAGPPLQPGITYSLIVTTNTGRSSQEDKTPTGQLTTNLDFKILRSAEAKAVQAMTEKLLQGNFQDETVALMLATYYGDYLLTVDAIAAYGLTQDNYQTYSLSAEAIALLETQVQQGKQSPALYRALGDLYWQTGLLRLAGEAYQQAIAQVKAPEDLEEWTLASYGLGKVYAVLKEPQKTLQNMTQARAGFIFLGNSEKAKELDRQIERLRKATANSLTP